MAMEGDAIEVWHLSLDAAGEALPHALTLLDATEREQYRSYATAALARAFALRRAARRLILARHLGIAPAEVEIAAGPQGKPLCAGLAFSASHSVERALIAVARSGPLGVDIERIGRRGHAILEQGILGPRERALLDRMPQDRRAQAMLRFWCAKEAVVKAAGTGLDLESLPAIELTDLADGWIQVTAPARQGGDWQVHTRFTDDGYAIGLAARRSAVITDRSADRLLGVS